MPRYKLTIEYDGSVFVGWQRQALGATVQASLEAAVELFCGQKTRVHGAGRTDAGVHALAQVAHVDLAKAPPTEVVRSALNHHLKPLPIAVLAVETVADNFDARRSARRRAYLYRIINRRPPLTIDRARAWHVGAPLDADAMHRAAQVLVGQHDFTTFRDSMCQAKSPVKTLDVLDVSRIGEEVRIVAEARSFLHHQIRNITGTLKLVGAGKWRAADVEAALAARDRRAGGPTAPPDGLYLTHVGYGDGASDEGDG